VAASSLASAATLASVASGSRPGGEHKARPVDLVGTDTLIQQHVPQEMLGRVYGIVYGGDQLALIGSSVIAAPLVALAGARVAFVIAGVGVLASLPLLLPILRRNPEPGSLIAEAAL
jgi:MFS family permease